MNECVFRQLSPNISRLLTQLRALATPPIRRPYSLAQAPFRSIMEALLRQSRSMCPFLSKTSPATLRSLSTTAATAAAHYVSPGAGSMSNLQVLARRCPIMGKALAVQSARCGSSALAGAFGGVRAYHSRVDRAKLHTSTPKEAQAVDIETLRPGSNPLSILYTTSHLQHLNICAAWKYLG
jgi:hypothetical protein